MQRRTFVKIATGSGAALALHDSVRAQETPAAASPVASPAAARSVADVNGVRLAYTAYGAGAPGTPLVLLHGGLLTGGLAFGAVAPELGQSRPVIVPDLRAHGGTADVPGPLRFEDIGDDIAALLEHLSIGEADIFGYSLGGGAAWQLAIRHPERVRKLAIASAPVRRSGWYPEALAGFAGVNADAAAALVGTPLQQAYAAVAPRPEDWTVLVTKVGELLAQEYDWTDVIAAIPAPTLFAIGDADSVMPEHALEIFRLRGGGVPGDFVPLPAAQLVVLPHTPHSSVLVRTGLLLEDVPAFLDGAPVPGA